ncbi:uncharacterized protein [Panulirus ornatus]|uniref:uncharacterized protein n=1 Tax=Panulirus ornatus TaxID=150431 RepID=UPI003A839932
MAPLPVPPADERSSLPVPSPADEGSPLLKQPLKDDNDDESMASSLVRLLVERQSEGGTGKGRPLHSATPIATHNCSKIQLLQVRLDQLQAEVHQLEENSQLLEARLKRFLQQHRAVVAASDQLELKLDTLARSQKTVSAQSVRQ